MKVIAILLLAVCLGLILYGDDIGSKETIVAGMIVGGISLLFSLVAAPIEIANL